VVGDPALSSSDSALAQHLAALNFSGSLRGDQADRAGSDADGITDCILMQCC